MITLLPVSAAIGVLLLLAFRYTSNQRAIRKVKARLYGSLYEMLLFGDEPALVWRAQAALLWANVRYIGLMLVPILVLALPMLVLFANLEAVYGREALRLGEPALVVAQVRQPLDLSKPAPVLEAPEGIDVESPAVRIPAENQVSWRIRARRAVSGSIRILFPDGAVEKRIEAGEGARYLSARRVNSLAQMLLYPGESRIGGAVVDWIEIQYSPKEIRWLGVEMHWAIWLFAFSMIAALLLKSRLNVVF